MDSSNILWLLGMLVEACVVGLLVIRGVWRTLPIFSFYCLWDLTINGLMFSLSRHFTASYLSFYLGTTILDTVLVFAVLTEVSWSVLRPIQEFVSNRTLIVISVFFVLIGLLAWSVTGVSGLGPIRGIIVHIQQTSSLLRILMFLILAGSSQVLSIGWRDRELQVATGMGFYSLVSFGAILVHTHQTSFPQYRALNEIVVASYLCSLLYWVYSFAQQEAERREFTPQMQNFLLAAAGVAREQRLALVQASMERHRQNS